MKFLRWSRVLAILALALVHVACDSPGSESEPKDDEGQVVRAPDLRDDPRVLSAPILGQPIYECTDTVFVSGFVPNATVTVHIDGNPMPAGMFQSIYSNGQVVKVSTVLKKGMVITVRQQFNGQTSGDSNAVTVRLFTDDYPSGIPPKPLIDPPPLYRCGLATGARDVLPGARLQFQAEPALGGGAFGPLVTIATVNGSGAAQWTTTSPAFELGARVTAKYTICTTDSPLSDPQIVQQQPAVIAAPTIDQGYEGQELIVVRSIVNGAMLRVYRNAVAPANEVVGHPTPGGSGQLMRVNPVAQPGVPLIPTQALCDRPIVGPPMTPLPCADLPAAKIKPPEPGDVQVEVTDFVPGSRIQIYANGQEIGDGGGAVINLSRPVEDGEVILVLQSLGNCKSRFVFQVTVHCRISGDVMACSADWPAFRHNSTRNAQQTKNSVLADPLIVRTLKPGWPAPFRPAGAQGFRASPIVYKDKVYVGNGNGRLYALDANTGNMLWQYPPANQPALTSQFTCNPSSRGLASSATIARIRNEVDAVIFGAPDQSLSPGFGSGRLFAINANTGQEIWKSAAVAVLNGTTGGSTTELHEQIGYSSPLVRNGKVYIGVANHCDNPIQNGKVMAVDLNSGALVGGFSYQSTNARGGGVWSSVAAGSGGELYITTGNTNSGGAEPSVNHGLSLLRLDPTTGAIGWKFQPVPFAMDGDPDWASGPAAMKSSCGSAAVSTQKDGWSYAVNATAAPGNTPSVRWQFPPTGYPFNPQDGTAHGDTRYLVPGAAWADVFITMTGGINVVNQLGDGFTRLHGLNVCSANAGRVRWLFDVPHTQGCTAGGCADYQLGPPTVTRGIVFVGTAQGRVVVFADPTRVPHAGLRCSNPRIANAMCVANGFQLVPQPAMLANVLLDGSRILTEPTLARGRVYVASEGGNVYMLQP